MPAQLIPPRTIMSRSKCLALELSCEGNDLFVCLNGERIAKRCRVEIPRGQAWVSLKTGYRVRSSPDLKSIDIEFLEEEP
jgi:hypothetical protein